MSDLPIKRVSPIFVFVASVLTLGVYLLFWYERIYNEIESLTGKTPTGNSVILDLILSLFTFGIWAIYVDYQISTSLMTLEGNRDTSPGILDSRLIVIILDVAAYFTIFITFFLSSSIQQDQMNRIIQKRNNPPV